jgi:hypothetical protein
MELNNLAMADPIKVKKLFESYSTSPTARTKSIRQMLNNIYPEGEVPDVNEIIKVIKMLYRTIGLDFDNDQTAKQKKRAIRQANHFLNNRDKYTV